MFHLSDCLRSVSNSWWSACSSSSLPAYFLPSQKSCRPWPNAPGGFPQPLKSFPCLVSTTVLATREGLETVEMLSRSSLQLILNQKNPNIGLVLTDAANSISSPPIIPFTDFYNLTLDHIDFMEDYHTWQAHGNSNRCECKNIISHNTSKFVFCLVFVLKTINLLERQILYFYFYNIVFFLILISTMF